MHHSLINYFVIIIKSLLYKRNKTLCGGSSNLSPRYIVDYFPTTARCCEIYSSLNAKLSLCTFN